MGLGGSRYRVLNKVMNVPPSFGDALDIGVGVELCNRKIWGDIGDVGNLVVYDVGKYLQEIALHQVAYTKIKLLVSSPISCL